MGNRDDCLAASPHRSGLSGARRGIYRDVCPNRLVKEACIMRQKMPFVRAGNNAYSLTSDVQAIAGAASEFQSNGNASFDRCDADISIQLKCACRLDRQTGFNSIEKRTSIGAKHVVQLNGNHWRARDVSSCRSCHCALRAAA